MRDQENRAETDKNEKTARRMTGRGRPLSGEHKCRTLEMLNIGNVEGDARIKKERLKEESADIITSNKGTVHRFRNRQAGEKGTDTNECETHINYV